MSRLHPRKSVADHTLLLRLSIEEVLEYGPKVIPVIPSEANIKLHTGKIDRADWSVYELCRRSDQSNSITVGTIEHLG